MWKLSYLDSTWKLKPRPDVEIKPEYGNVFICFFFALVTLPKIWPIWDPRHTFKF